MSVGTDDGISRSRTWSHCASVSRFSGRWSSEGASNTSVACVMRIGRWAMKSAPDGYGVRDLGRARVVARLDGVDQFTWVSGASMRLRRRTHRRGSDVLAVRPGAPGCRQAQCRIQQLCSYRHGSLLGLFASLSTAAASSLVAASSSISGGGSKGSARASSFSQGRVEGL